MSRDYENRLHGFITVDKKEELGRYKSVKLVKGDLKTVDKFYIIEDVALDSLDLIVNNSRYTPEYLKSIYIVQFYKILQKVNRKLSKNGN